MSSTVINADDVASEEPPISEEHKKEKRYAVVEIFGPTIQGEGALAGSKTMFVRFGGCDYRCQKCDSLHAVIPSAVKAGARYLTAEEITEELVKLRGISGCQWVTFSGGNPCMWDLTRLIQFLKGVGFAITVETQGTIWQQWLTQCSLVVISPKSPGMGEKFEPEKFVMMLTQLWAASIPVCVKIVAFSQQDMDFAVDVHSIVKQLNPPPDQEGMMFLSLGNPFPPVLNSSGTGLQENPILANPEDMRYDGKDHRIKLLEHYKSLVEDFLADPRLPFFRFLPQLHVLLYSNESEK